MIIANSSIGMDSARTYTSVSRESRTIEGGIIIPFSQKLDSASNDAGKISSDGEDKEKSSTGLNNPKESFDDIYNRMKTFVTSGMYELKCEADAMDKVRSQCIQYLMYLLFGVRPDAMELVPQKNVEPTNSGNSNPTNAYLQTTVTSSSLYAEQESTSFSTQGTVVTADGREINFNLDLSMSRSFASYYENSVSTLQAFTDPLVINLDSSIAEVSDVKVMFDLDGDGIEESISKLSSSSGYLSLDLNGDGIINNGNELFGTQSGDGFKDLSEYDEDGNGWIDEADSIYSKLKICVLNDDGSQTLYSLKEKDVGAICLQSAETDFSLNNLSTNECNARIRKTGIFLYENGSVGTMQHLDLAQ